MANLKNILEGQWKEGRDFVPELLRAKAESDRKNYSAKHDILRRLIKESPGEFLIDSEENGIYGITHRPSGFKLHLLKDVTPPELIRAQPEKQDKATVLNRIMKKHPSLGTKKQEDDVYVHSSVPAASLDMVKKHGLLSSQAILNNPEALASFLDGSKGTDWEVDEEGFKKKVEEKLKDDFWNPSYSGPSVFFGEPDPDKITDVHPTRKIKSETLRVNLSKLLRDHPKTRIAGSELHPYDPEGPEYQGRHYDIDLDKVREYVATDPKELWKHYDSPEGTHYASNVPHGQLITPSRGIPPEYLEFTDTQEAIFDKLKEHLPEGARHSSGGMPDVRGTSDVDVSLYHSDPAQVLELLPKGTTIRSQREDTGSIEYAVPGYSRDVNVYVTSDPDAAQRSVDHRRTEIELQEQFPELYQSAMALKRDGRNTEQAWADTLGVKKDPYVAMRDTKSMLATAATLNKQDTDFGKQAADKKRSKAMVKRMILADAINSLISKETGVRKDLADALVQSGVPTTVVTNAPPEGIREQLSEYPFDVYSQQGEPRKEDPEFFRELLKEKQLSPEEVFYFDHNPANLAAARKAGIRGVPFASDISNLLASLSKEKQAAEEQWIGVDLDGTLAKYRGWKGVTHIGAPIPSMVSRVKRWLREGKVVKIFTARVAENSGTARRAIEKWCKTHIGKVLPITCVKDKNCVRIWDDRAVGVKSNKGRQVKLEYADKRAAVVKLAKARSKSQQRLFGMVHAAQKGKDVGSAKVQEMAKNISKKDVSDFAETKHKGLPNRKRKRKKSKDKEASANVLYSVAAICLVNHSSVS